LIVNAFDDRQRRRPPDQLAQERGDALLVSLDLDDRPGAVVAH
jgi:hypothetical protein